MEFLSALPVNFPFITIVVGLFAALLCLFLKGRAARICAIAAQGLSALLDLGSWLWLRFSGRETVVYRLGPAGASNAAVNQLRFSEVETLLAAVFCLIILLSVLGGKRYVKKDVAPGKTGFYYLLLCLAGCAVSALIYTNDLFTGYVFVEILTLSSCGLLMVRELGRTTVASIRYMIVNLVGSGLFLLGVILLYGVTGNLLMEEVRAVLDGMGSPTLPVYSAAALIAAGLALKSGAFPFYFWMPDTYGCATPTSSAVLSGVVSKGYVLLLMKVLLRVLGPFSPVTQKLGWLLLAAGVCGMIFGSVSAIRQRTLFKMLAFSSAAQIGYIYTGIGIGCLFGSTDAAAFGFAAAVFHMLTHAFTKPPLFLSAARLSEVSNDTSVFANLRGSAARARLAAICFTAGALSMVGVPLFAGFSSKVIFAIAAVRTGKPVLFIVILAALAVSTLLNTLYFLRTVITLYADGRPGTALPAEGQAAPSETQGASLPETASPETPATAPPVPDCPPKELKPEKGLLFAALSFTALNIALGVGVTAVVNVLLHCFGGGLF